MKDRPARPPPMTKCATALAAYAPSLARGVACYQDRLRAGPSTIGGAMKDRPARPHDEMRDSAGGAYRPTTRAFERWHGEQSAESMPCAGWKRT